MREKATRKLLIGAQRNEISEHQTYLWLAKREKNPRNRGILKRIAEDEKNHYQIFQRITKTDAKPRKFRVFWYQLLSNIFGLSFGLRLMERGEEVTQRLYAELRKELPELADVLLDEQKHETDILGMIEEERIQYAGSIVLGLNDALVELTGALAGLTLALRDSQVIAMAGFVTGVAASMSMAASEYLSSREEAEHHGTKNPLKSSAYTGMTYLATVLVLIAPYFLLGHVFSALAVMVGFSLLIILSYNYYIATAKNIKLWPRFFTMAALSLSVACISFLVGLLARKVFGVDL